MDRGACHSRTETVRVGHHISLPYLLLAMYQLLASNILPTVSMDLPILNISYKFKPYNIWPFMSGFLKLA